MVAQGGRIKLDNTLDSRLALISHQVSKQSLSALNVNKVNFLHIYFLYEITLAQAISPVVYTFLHSMVSLSLTLLMVFGRHLTSKTPRVIHQHIFYAQNVVSWVC